MQIIKVKKLCKTIILRSRIFFRKLNERVRENFDSVRYYAVLLAVLGALGTAAYQYRSSGEPVAKTEPPAQELESVETAVEMPTFSAILPETKEITAIAPVSGGSVVNSFCVDQLNWSEDLQQWQTHEGTDYSGEAGTAVTAVFDGVVTDVFRDSLYGNTVVIDHRERGEFRYASLSTLEMAEIGQRVKQGEIIGGVGTCLAEASLGVHVHLEYIVDGQHGDFEELMEVGNGKTDGNLQD